MRVNYCEGCKCDDCAKQNECDYCGCGICGFVNKDMRTYECRNKQIKVKERVSDAMAEDNMLDGGTYAL